MSKKIIFVFVFLITFILLPLNAYAQSYTTKDLTVSIDDNEWVVFTRDNIKDNPKLDELGITYNYINSFMTTNDVYLDACKFDDEDNDNSLELFVVAKKVDNVNNLHTYSSNDIKDLGKEVQNKVNADSYQVYTSNKYKYIYLEYYDSNNDYYISEYYTVMNGYGYTILAQKTNELTNDELSDIKKIVNTISYKYNSKYEKSSSSNISTYTLIGGIAGGVIGGITAIITAVKKKKKTEEN